MDVHHIRYFLAVCGTLNFTRAAEDCKISQPALSRAIQQLEDEVGGQLFRRERSLTHLTDLGMVMKPRLQQILDELGDVRREAKRFLAMEEARLSIGVMCTIAPARFAGLIAEFGRRFPGIKLKVEEGVPTRLAARLKERRIDLAIMASPDGFEFAFSQDPLYEERFVVAFPVGHRFAEMAEVPLSALDSENYLNRINCEYDNKIDAVCANLGVTVHSAYASEREDWIQNLIAGGLGIAIIPEFTAVAPGLQIRPLVQPAFHRDIKLVALRDSETSGPAHNFTETVRSYPWPQSRFLAVSSAA